MRFVFKWLAYLAVGGLLWLWLGPIGGPLVLIWATYDYFKFCHGLKKGQSEQRP